MARKRDLEYGGRAVARILRSLKAPEELTTPYLKGILAQAKKNAATKPTPQARMVAANLAVDGDLIAPKRGGDAADVAFGSEFGSRVYPQFHKPPNAKGYWLYPAAESALVLATADEALEAIVEDAVDG